MKICTKLSQFIKENVDNEISTLKKRLSDLDEWFYNGGKGLGNRAQELWDEKYEEAANIRGKLIELTGDSYGISKKEKHDKLEAKLKKPKGLNSIYDDPNDVPIAVYKWIFNNTSLLNTDASDAVRYSRIINTKVDKRYSKGELTIYRAVDNHNYNTIREGDWVTIEEKYAIQHNDMYFEGKGKIISMDVDGRDVLVSPTGNYEEAIYAPLEYSIDVDL